MKKIGIFSVALLLSVVAFSNVTKENNKTSVADLESSTTDFMNEKSNVKKVALRNASSGSNAFKASKIYFQTASDSDGYEYLRFASALRGAYSKVSFTRHIEGLEDKTDEVTTLYKGIAANGKVSFTNGDELVDYDVTSTKNYYWACYTIRFKSDSTYKESDITLTLKVDDKYTDSRTISLNNAKNYVEDNSLNFSFDQEKSYVDYFALDYNLTDIGVKLVVGDYRIIHGACNDLDNPRYAYFSLNKVQNRFGVIAKYDFEEKKIVGYSKEFTNYNEADTSAKQWTDNANIFYYNGKIYTLDAYGNFMSVVASEITGNNAGDVIADNTMTFKDAANKGIVNIKSAAYNKKSDRFAVYSSNKMYIYDGKFNLLKSFDCGSFQMIYSTDSKFIGLINGGGSYNTTTKDSNDNDVTATHFYDTATVVSYDLDGNMLFSNTYGTKTCPIGDCYVSDRRHTNIQSIIIYNGELYFIWLAYDAFGNRSGAGYLIKFETVNITKAPNVSLGEYAEHNKTIGKENDFTIREIMKGKTAPGTNYLQGVTTDNTNVYYAFTDGNNSNVVLVRSNPLTGEWFVSPKPINIGKNSGNDAGKIFFYNNSVWLTMYDNKQVIEVNKDTLEVVAEKNEQGEDVKDTDGNIVPNSIMFNKITENIKNVGFDKFNNRFVVLGNGGTLYFLNEDLTIEKSVKSVGFSGNKLTNMFVNDDYIYVTYGNNGIKSCNTSIYDFNGTLINQVKVGGNNLFDYVSTNFNAQGLIDFNGTILVIGLSWGGSDISTGGYVYSVKMN